MDRPLILDNGKDVIFHSASLEGKTTLTACEELCPRYSSCDTAAMANDELHFMKKPKKQVMGLKN